MFKYIKVALTVGLILVGCAKNPDLVFDKDGYNHKGYNVTGYNRDGFDIKGFNRNGFDVNGYNKDGYDINGYNKSGYNIDGYDVKGFNRSSFDVNGYNKNGYDVNGYNKKGLNIEGLTKEEVLKKKFKELIKTKSNIKEVFNSNVKLQVRDKYESDSDYENRMKNINFTEYAIMDIDVTTEYDPNNKVYKVFLDTKTPLYMLKNKIENGILDNISTKQSNVKFSDYALSDNDESEKKDYKDLQSNAYGHTVEVTTYTGKKYVIHPNNLQKILSMDNFKTYTKEYYGNDLFYYIGLNVDKNKAISLDKSKVKLKVKVKFNNVLDLYKGSFVTSATIDSPTAMFFTYYFFGGHIEEAILYNQKTKEILFSYID